MTSKKRYMPNGSPCYVYCSERMRFFACDQPEGTAVHHVHVARYSGVVDHDRIQDSLGIYLVERVPGISKEHGAHMIPAVRKYSLSKRVEDDLGPIGHAVVILCEAKKSLVPGRANFLREQKTSRRATVPIYIGSVYHWALSMPGASPTSRSLQPCFLTPLLSRRQTKLS